MKSSRRVLAASDHELQSASASIDEVNRALLARNSGGLKGKHTNDGIRFVFWFAMSLLTMSLLVVDLESDKAIWATYNACILVACGFKCWWVRA